MLTNITTSGSAVRHEDYLRSLRWVDAVAAATALVLAPLLGVALALSLGVLALLAGRALVRRAATGPRPAGAVLPRALMVGDLSGILDLLTALQERPPSDVEPVAAYVPAATGPHSTDPGSAFPLQQPGGEDARVDGILEACAEHRIDSVLLTTSAPLTEEEIERLGLRLAEARVDLVFTAPAGHRVNSAPTPELL